MNSSRIASSLFSDRQVAAIEQARVGELEEQPPIAGHRREEHERRRGALRVLWELRGDPLTFRALQDACDSNPGSLNTRLRELRERGIVDHNAGGYRLTGHGRTLMTALEPLQDWADDWAATTGS
jgi:DNA-binding HxlR family transcriptional regulator